MLALNLILEKSSNTNLCLADLSNTYNIELNPIRLLSMHPFGLPLLLVDSPTLPLLRASASDLPAVNRRKIYEM